MLPTLLELSMLPSVRLSLKLMLKLFTIPMEDMDLDTVSILLDMVMGMVIMLDSDTLLWAMVIMVTVLDILGTMESVKLRLSQRLMLSMELTDMVMDLDTVPTPLDMAETLAMDMDMVVGMDMGMDMDTTVEYYNNKIKSRIFLTVSKVELTNIMSCYKNEIIKTLC